MLFRGQISRCTRLLATTLAAGLSLACGDDADSSAESASETDEHADGEHDKAGSSSKPSSGKAGASSAKADAGSESDEAATGGNGGAAADKPDEPKDADKPKDEPKKDDKPAADNGDKKPQTEPTTLKVSLRFHATVGKSDFACSHKYAGQGTANTTVTPLDLRLFVHAIELVKEDGAKVALSLIPREPWQSETLALLDFEDKTGRCSDGTVETNTAITGTVPAGSYKGVRFVVGVPDDLNHQDPAKASEPLKSAASLGAAAVDGYRFAKVGLTQLTSGGDASGSGLFDLGSTQCTGSVADNNVKCEKPNRNLIELGSFDLAKNSVAIDIAKLFAQVDLTQPQACHSVEKSCVPMFSAFGVDFTTGQPNTAQSLFSVE